MDQPVKSWPEIWQAVAEFHEAFGIGNNSMPCIIEKDEILLRYRLMREENEEYLDAAMNGDIQGVADALGDQLYVLCGTMLRHGLQHLMADVFDEIHRSNMSKLDENGKPLLRNDGKVIKSSRYSAPDLSRFFSKK